MILPLILAIALPLPDGGYLTHRSPVYQLHEFVSVQQDVSFLFSFPAAYEVQSSTKPARLGDDSDLHKHLYRRVGLRCGR